MEAVPTIAPATPQPIATARPEDDAFPFGIWIEINRRNQFTNQFIFIILSSVKNIVQFSTGNVHD